MELLNGGMSPRNLASTIDSEFSTVYSLFGFISIELCRSPRFRPPDLIEDIFIEIWIEYEILEVLAILFHVVRSPFPFVYSDPDGSVLN